MSEIKEIEIIKGEGMELKPQERLSPSSINQYYKCPRSYFYNYIAKLRVPPNINLVKGSIVHGALEDFFRNYTPDLDAKMEELYLKNVKKYEKALKDIGLESEAEEKELQDIANMLHDFLEMFKRKMKNLIDAGKAEEDRHAFFLLKPKFREKFVEDKELHCCGYIDRISEDYNGIVTLGDYKTSSKYSIGIPEDYKRQLAIYSLLYTSEKKTPPDFVAVIFLRYGEEYLLEVTPSLLKYARDTIGDAYAKTRSADITDYPLKEGSLCRWCSYQNVCSGQADWEEQYRLQKLEAKLKEEKKDDA